MGRSRLLVARMRTLTRTGAVPPTRSISRSWITRSSLACRRTSISLISSSSSVPPSAASNLPARRATAPLNAPRSCPNSSDSSRFSGMAAQFSATNGPAARRERRWMCRASTSLPVPDSPVIRMLASDAATCSARRTAASIAGSRAIMACVSPDAASRMAAIRSGSGGSGRNSRAPSWMARTAWGAPASVPQATMGMLNRSADMARSSAAMSCGNSTSSRSTRASARNCARAERSSSAWCSFAPRAAAIRAALPSSPPRDPKIRTCIAVFPPIPPGLIPPGLIPPGRP